MKQPVVQRLNNGLLGTFERPILHWLARRLPPWVLPDHLSLCGVCGSLIAAFGYVGSRWSIQWLWLACIGVILNWAGDSLDGTVARFRRIERHHYGFFVDRIADLWSKPIIFLGLAFSSLARFDVIAMALVVLLMASAYSLVYSHASREQRITYAGFGPTEIRFLLICANLFTLSFGIADASQWIPLRTDLPVITVFDLLAITLSAAAFVTLALLTLRDRRALDREDPIIGAPAFRDPPQDTAPSIPLPSPRNAA